MKKLKVIVWGLGSVGRYAIKMIMQKQALELVGAIDIDSEKVGKDAGELFGFDKAGIIVSNDIDGTLAIDADVVLVYLPNMRDEGNFTPTGFTPNAENICRALNAGKNVVTTLPVYFSRQTAPKLFEMVDACAKKNNVTYVSQGIFPGLYTPYLPVVLSSMAGRVDKVIVTGGQDDAFNTSPWVKVFGYGVDPQVFNAELLKKIITSYYGCTVLEIAERVGLDYDEYVETHEVVLAETEMNPPCGHVKVGTISAHVFKMSVLKNNEEVAGFHFVHKVCDDMQKYPSVVDSIHIEGEPTLDITIEGMIPGVESFATSAAPSINLIPTVVAAEPGFKEALDLPVSVPVK